MYLFIYLFIYFLVHFDLPDQYKDHKLGKKSGKTLLSETYLLSKATMHNSSMKSRSSVRRTYKKLGYLHPISFKFHKEYTLYS
jgi:CRISPR/Cas system-associated protein endoribonuclease Cas2